jgi:hypothetical protein
VLELQQIKATAINKAAILNLIPAYFLNNMCNLSAFIKIDVAALTALAQAPGVDHGLSLSSSRSVLRTPSGTLTADLLSAVPPFRSRYHADRLLRR